jgi:hypothetical protein
MMTAALRGAMEPPMTDETPSPTTRIPVPEPPPEEPTEGWPGEIAATDARVQRDPRDPGWSTPPPALTATPPTPHVAPSVRRDERDHGRTASILFGLVVLGLGLWFLADHTLGIELPRIRWSQIWPAILIVIGLWVVLGSTRRGSR